MKRKSIVIGVAAAVAAILAACGGHDNSGASPPMSSTPTPPTPPTPPSTNLSLTTNEFLMGYAEQPSETASPHAVNDGALGFSDTSETSTPISVNGS
jgi:hypothetical protein